jgi:4-amino-4-deoxy-L-arabinose transferase-like glycosyltransferase
MSAVSGLATMVALGWGLYRTAGRTAALCGLWLWAAMPFAVLHERLALQDPFITSLLAWAVALMIRGAGNEKTPAGWWLGAGALFGVACLFKISAVLALPWLGLLYLALQIDQARPVFNRRLAFIALGAVGPLLCLGPALFHLGGNSVQMGFLPSLSGGNYWAQAAQRLPQWTGWLAGYGGWPLALLAVGALPLAARRRSRLGLAAGAGAALALVVVTLVHNRPFARYVLPDQVPLILFIALAWGPALAKAGRGRIVALALLAVAVGRWAFVSQQIARTPTAAPVPTGEIEQYYTGPWSGRGLDEVEAFLANYADEHHVTCVVLTHRYHRPGAYGLILAAAADPRIAVVPITVYEPEEFALARQAVARAAGTQPAAFFILYEGSLYPAHPWLDVAGGPTRRVLTVPRGPGEQFTLYQFEAR